MNLVALSTDRRILSQEAPLQEAYAQHFSAYTIFVVCRGGGHQARQFAENGLAHPLQGKTFFSRTLWGALWRADVISVQDPFEVGLLGLLFAFIVRKPLHAQVHTDIFSNNFSGAHRLNAFRTLLAHIVLRRAKRIRVVSEKVKEDLEARGVKAPISVLPIFVERSRFIGIARKKHPEWKISLLCIGRLEKEKRFGEAIQAVAVLRAHNHDVGLTIVGDGTQRPLLEKQARDARIERFVRFVGAQKDTVPYLETADALLVPSAYEGYGLVIIEALSAGVPVISYDVGIAQESGAIIAPPGEFAETVRAWVGHGPRTAELLHYPYTDRDSYVRAWVHDVQAAAQ